MAANRRGNISREEELKVYVRAGGRCTMCQTYLLEGALSAQPMKIGEMAHIVGATTADGSPRGKDPLGKKEREKAENLMLLCRGEHKEIDRAGSEDWATVEKLRGIKADHEAWIRRVTGLDRSRNTTVLRMVGAVQGNVVSVTKADAADAVLVSGDRYPKFPLSADDFGFEIDLSRLDESDDNYWADAMRQIDRVLQHKLNDAVAEGEVDHVSVFGFARLPLLIHLGARLDDTFGVDIYDRHRSTESWNWPDTTSAALFRTGVPTNPEGSEAVLVLNISGTIDDRELPEALTGLPRWRLEVANATPAPGALVSAADLAAFSAATRELLAQIEASSKLTKRLHVFAALPLSAAVQLGRVHDPHVHPHLAVYHRTGGRYAYALELT